jgi:hypothetical protein
MIEDMTLEAANEWQMRREGYRRWVFADMSAIWKRERSKDAKYRILEDGTWQKLRDGAKT